MNVYKGGYFLLAGPEIRLQRQTGFSSLGGAAASVSNRPHGCARFITSALLQLFTGVFACLLLLHVASGSLCEGWGWGWGRGSWRVCPPDESCRNVSLGRKPPGEKCVLWFYWGEKQQASSSATLHPPPPLPHSPHTPHPSSFFSCECAPWRSVELWVLVCRTLRLTSLKSKRQIKESFSGKGRSRIK